MTTGDQVQLGGPLRGAAGRGELEMWGGIRERGTAPWPELGKEEVKDAVVPT
jgi:hypothetical protein